MEFHTFQRALLFELMSWFPTRESCQTWGGRDFRFPFSPATFREDAKIETLPTWAMSRADGSLVGFGQFYARLGRCHLGRLAIAPASRGGGLGSKLIRGLCDIGRAELGLDSHSLFVLPHNEGALRVYERLGFRAVPYPEPSPELEGCVYMVASGLAPDDP